MERQLDELTLERLNEYKQATDVEIADAVRMEFEMPGHALSKADWEKRERLLFTVRALLCRGLR